MSTERDISIEDILENPSLDNIGVAVKKTKEKEKEKEKEPKKVKPAVEETVDKESEFVPEVESVEEDKPVENLDALLKTLDSEEKIVPKEGSNEIRPPTMDVAITNDPDELLQGAENPEAMVKQLMEDPTKNDNLCTVFKQEDNTGILLGHVMGEIAEELAYLKAYRKIHYIAEEDTSDISLKRTKALETLVKALVEKDKLKHGAEGKIDFYGEKFEKIMEFVLGIVKDAFEKVGIPDQFNDIFFVQLAQDLEGFEKKVEKIYYGVPQTKSSKK